MQAFSEVPARP